MVKKKTILDILMMIAIEKYTFLLQRWDFSV
jgi:hypothetical protein